MTKRAQFKLTSINKSYDSSTKSNFCADNLINVLILRAECIYDEIFPEIKGKIINTKQNRQKYVFYLDNLLFID